jgi:hypothetical protein
MMTADWLAAVKTATLGIDWSHCRFRYYELRNVVHTSKSLHPKFASVSMESTTPPLHPALTVM